MTKPLYSWEGRNLLMDTIVHRKRYVLNGKSSRVPCSFDVRRWVMPPEDEIMGKAWEQIARHYQKQINRVDRRYRNDLKAKAIWRFVIEQIPYVREKDNHDFWQFPPETLHLRHGDCEDRSFLCASLLMAAGIPPQRVRVAIGTILQRGAETPSEGHAWPMYRNTHNVWCILEPNFPHLPIRITRGREAQIVIPRRPVGINKAAFISANRLAADDCSRQYIPLLCFNHQAVWTVELCKPGTVDAARQYQPDWNKNPTFNQILATINRPRRS